MPGPSPDLPEGVSASFLPTHAGRPKSLALDQVNLFQSFLYGAVVAASRAPSGVAAW